MSLIVQLTRVNTEIMSMRCSVCKKVLPEGRKLRRCKKCQRSYSKKYMQQRRSKFRDQEFQSSQNPMDLDWTRPLWDCSEDEFPRITEEMGIRDSSDWRTARVRAIYKERF